MACAADAAGGSFHKTIGHTAGPRLAFCLSRHTRAATEAEAQAGGGLHPKSFEDGSSDPLTLFLSRRERKLSMQRLPCLGSLSPPGEGQGEGI